MPVDFNISDYSGFSTIRQAAELLEYLAQPMFTSTETGQTARVINHWEESGILNNPRSKDQRWRRYSLPEYCWIKIVDQLRNTGLSLDTIKRVKDDLFRPIELAGLWNHLADNPEFKQQMIDGGGDEDPEEIAQFIENKEWLDTDEEFGTIDLMTMLVSDVVKDWQYISLVVFPEGGHFPWYHSIPMEDEYLQFIQKGTFVSVSLTEILKEFLKGDLAPSRVGKLHILDEVNTKVVEMIHSGEYESVKINFKDKKMASLELVKSQEVTRKIVDVLTDSNYQDISITTHRGMVTRIENTIKMKL